MRAAVARLGDRVPGRDRRRARRSGTCTATRAGRRATCGTSGACSSTCTAARAPTPRPSAAIQELLGVEREPSRRCVPRTRPGCCSRRRPRDQPGRLQRPVRGGRGVGGARRAAASVTANGREIAVDHPGAYPLVEHERHTAGVLELRGRGRRDLPRRVLHARALAWELGVTALARAGGPARARPRPRRARRRPASTGSRWARRSGTRGCRASSRCSTAACPRGVIQSAGSSRGGHGPERCVWPNTTWSASSRDGRAPRRSRSTAGAPQRRCPTGSGSAGPSPARLSAAISQRPRGPGGELGHRRPAPAAVAHQQLPGALGGARAAGAALGRHLGDLVEQRVDRAQGRLVVVGRAQLGRVAAHDPVDRARRRCARTTGTLMCRSR